MEKKLTIEIDLEKITSDILEKETYSDGGSGYAIIQNMVKKEIKDSIRSEISSEIKKSLNLEEFKQSGYSGNYLKEEAHKIISEELETKVKAETKRWIEQNMRYVIEKQAEKSIEEFLVPRLQRMISNLLVVNTEVVDDEMQLLRDEYESQISDIESSF